MEDLFKFYLETVANNLEDPEKEASINATYDDIIDGFDNILFHLDVIEFLITPLSDAATLYPDSCDITSEAILHWLCDQVLAAVQVIEDQYAFIENNPVGRINIMYGWFKPYMDVHINRYLRELGAQRYKGILNSQKCATGIHGLNGTVVWMRKYGHGQLKYYTERLRLFALREKERNS